MAARWDRLNGAYRTWLLDLAVLLLILACNRTVKCFVLPHDTRHHNLNSWQLRAGDRSAEAAADAWTEAFTSVLTTKQSSVEEVFVGDGVPFWRDMVAFSWNILTLEGAEAIQDFVDFLHEATDESVSFERDTNHEIIAQNEKVEFCALFQTSLGSGRAHIRLESGRATTLLTTLYDLHDCPFRVSPWHRNVVSVREPVPLRDYWHERQADQENPYVVIIGAGQAGLSLGARLHALDVPYLIIEAGESPGASWKKRYPSLCLHDPVYYNHLPYMHFPPTWPLFSPRDKIARWLELYADALDLNILSQTRVTAARKQGCSWEVNIVSEKTGTRVVSAKHLVFATGNSSFPKSVPKFPGKFNGLQLHSSEYKGGRHYRTCRHFVVVGSNTSAMDIVQDLWEQLHDTETDVHITLLQRSPSTVISTDSVLRLGLGPLWSETSDPEEADWRATTVPYRLALDRWKVATEKMRRNDRELLDGLARAGFQLDFGFEGTGIFAKSASEGGGFYIDVGAATLISRGDVNVCGATIERLRDDGVEIQPNGGGSRQFLKADCIIYATGFATLEKWVAEICGEAVAKTVGRTWGIGLGHNLVKDPLPWEGELRNMWKPTCVENLWFQGGNLAQNRHYSRFLALQLAVRYKGVEPRVYGVPEPRNQF